MVKGLNIFRDRFRQFEGSFTLIGGAACDEWFTAQGLPFRATKDLDIVSIIEVFAPEAVRALRAFTVWRLYRIAGETQVVHRRQGAVTSGWCRKTFDVTYDSANRDLLDLVERKFPLHLNHNLLLPFGELSFNGRSD
jgi:hypothetical protein